MGQVCDTVFRLSPGATIAGSTTDFFTAITLTQSVPKVITFTVSLDTATKLFLRENSVNMPFNNDTNLTANALYTFSFVAYPDVAYTFRAGAACTIQHFIGIQSLE